jgi:transposase
MHGQFRKRYTQTTIEQKVYAVQEVLHSGRTRKELAEELNVSVNSITTWLRKYKECGENGFSSFSRDEMDRLKEIEKKYYEQLKEMESLKNSNFAQLKKFS